MHALKATNILDSDPHICGRGTGTLVGAVSDLGDDRDRVPVRANIIPAGRSGDMEFRVGLGFRGLGLRGLNSSFRVWGLGHPGV